MNKYHLPATHISEHLAFFQWFARTFQATRISAKNGAKWRGLDSRFITTKLHPSGVGMIYSKIRGTEIIEQVKHPHTGKPTLYLLNAIAYQESGNISGPFYAESMPPAIMDRIAWWKDHSPDYADDFRRKAILTAILNYQTPR